MISLPAPFSGDGRNPPQTQHMNMSFLEEAAPKAPCISPQRRKLGYVLWDFYLTNFAVKVKMNLSS